MNRSLKLIVLLLILISLTACTTKKEDNKEKSKEETKIEEKLEVNGYDLTLNKTATFENIRYKFPENTSINSFGTYTLLIYDDEEQEKQVFKIGITKFGYSTPEETVKGEKKDTKTINGLEWILFDTEGNNTYAHQDGHDTYTITFISDDDLTIFENEFMKNVSVIE